MVHLQQRPRGAAGGQRRLSGTRQRGALVEAAARAHLLRAGLEDVAANANYRLGELDLVMRDDDTLVFVEVRYRRGSGFGGGAASVDAGKRMRIARAAQMFLARHRQYAQWPCRFDVVAASGDPEAPTLDWIRDAFRLGD